MSDAIYRLIFTVDRENAAVTPVSTGDTGYAGDHLSAELRFAVGTNDYRYRLEIVDGSGGYDITEPLVPNGEGQVVYRVPSHWTAAGTATVRLIEYGEDERVTHFAPISLFFADREEGEAAEYHRPRFEVLLTTAETAVERASAAANRVEAVGDTLEQAGMLSQVAKETADEALQTAHAAATRAESVKGVFVGSGEMPDGYVVQIDPNGAAVPLEQLVRPPIAVLYNGDENAGFATTTTEPTEMILPDAARPSILPYRVFRVWVGDVGVTEQTATPLTVIANAPLGYDDATVGATVYYDEYGSRFIFHLYHAEGGRIWCIGTRKDADNNERAIGMYRIVGVL